MSSGNNRDAIKITAEDLAAVAIPEPIVPAPQPGPGGAKSYGSISDASDQAPEVAEGKGSILLQGWFYLGAAGLLGALIGWAICEPWFIDGQGGSWTHYLLLPILVTLMCIGFGVAESLVERSLRKGLIRAGLGFVLGMVLGFILDRIANFIYFIGMAICASAGAQSYKNPSVWLARGVAWMIFGVAGGVIYGIAGQSMKKAKFGILGGVIGAGLGGILFDPIAEIIRVARHLPENYLSPHIGAPSRAIGFALFGVATGIAMGWVESALKDRWFYVTGGPLAGKQFILYKQQTVIGSVQQSDIYLFKDPSILPQHAVIQINGSRVQLHALGSVYVSGQPVSNRVLMDGDLVQIGRYAFRYKERHRK